MMPVSIWQNFFETLATVECSRLGWSHIWGRVAVKLIMLPLLIAVAYVGFEHKDGMVDLYRAAYPDDPAKRDALDQCSRGIPNFNRLDSADRDNCYSSISGRVAAAAPYNPSHLPVSDVRRQEAFDGYRSMRGVAAASMVPPIQRVSHQ
jgi:hypothetical protein